MTIHTISRRSLAKLGLGMAATAGMTVLPGGLVGAASGSEPERDLSSSESALAASLQKAYSFLDTMMDAYAQGQTLRLTQSYSDQIGLESTAFVYDNAVAINAFLLRRQGDDVARAQVLGNAILYAQQNDAIGDGRVRQAYFVNQPDANGVFVAPALFPFFFLGSATGDMCWSGIALVQLFLRTRNHNFLNGAIKLGQWVVNNTLSNVGAGGFTFGVDAGNNKLTFKSTEHNIDAFTLFTMLAQATGDHSWLTQAQSARTFLVSMFNAAGGFFWTGTTGDGVTVNPFPIPEDVNTWSYLALLDKDFAASLDWAKTNLATTDTPQNVNSSVAAGTVRISGVTFTNFAQKPPIVNNNFAPSDPFSSAPDPGAVWLEGTAHLAAALLTRELSPDKDIPGFDGDRNTAHQLLLNIRGAQATQGTGQTVAGKPITAGTGVVAASSELNTGFGFSYKPNLHIGATGWYAIAGLGGNPFQPGLVRDRF